MVAKKIRYRVICFLIATCLLSACTLQQADADCDVPDIRVTRVSLSTIANCRCGIRVGLAIAIFLIFVARPVSVFVCLAPTRTSIREKLFISWVGLRGAVPIVLATFPILAKIEGANQLFDVVFFIVLISVLIQGFSLTPVARWLKLATVK